jgi:DNA-binding LacI/PurR family transcriptional regulator
MTGKRATMREVAELAGVSRTTVSFVLNDTPNANIPPKTRRRVLDAVRRLNYVPDATAVTLVTGRTQTLALVLRQTAHQLSADAFLGEVLRGLTRAVEPAGYHTLVHPVAPDMTYGQLARSQKVDGLILSGPMVEEAELTALHAEGTPIVVQGTTIPRDVPSVDVDNEAAARVAVTHLLALGHRRIGHITNARTVYAAAHDRLSGYCQALEAYGVPYDPRLVYEGDFTEDSGAAAMRALLDLDEPPTAVFVASDVVALGALQVIREHGLHVPDDISLVGFDNIPLVSHLDPGLTTIHLPAFELGQRAGEMLLSLVWGNALEQTRVLLETELVVRGSTGPPPA